MLNRRRENPKPIYSGAGGSLARIFDAALGVVAPRLVHAMQKARMRSAALLAYEGARVDRQFGRVSSASADAEALPDLAKLRAASRAMVRDDPHSSSAVRVLDENVIGTGLTPRSKPNPDRCGMSPEECHAWAKACEDAWREWCDEADATEHGTFYDLQSLALRSFIVDGEAFGHLVIDENGQPRCELLDVDRLMSPGFLDTDKFRGGVELGQRGEPVAYHVLPWHPNDVMGRGMPVKPDRIERWDGAYSVVQHVFRRRQPGLTRGIPEITAALTYTRALHDYLDSELAAARANSKIAMFVKRAAATSDPDIFPVQGGEGPQGMDRGYLQRLESGTIEYLEEGEEIAPFIPNRPGTSFDPFVVRSLRAICSTQGLPYEMVAKDFGQMNFASNRSLLLEVRRGFDAVRALLVRGFCTPWWNNVILARVASGDLQPPAQFLDDPRPFLQARWTHPPYGWVDPVSEVQASREAIWANLSTPYDEAGRSGLDAEEILAERAKFLRRGMELERENGLPPGSLNWGPPSGAAAAPPAAGAPAAAASGGAGGRKSQQKEQNQPAAAGAGGGE
jgi:lambda family phage portal protein